MRQLAASPSRRAAGAFTLIEFAISVAIIGVLAGMLLQRVKFYQEEAELAAVEQVVGTLRSALHLRMAQLHVHHSPVEMASLAEQNPMDWLSEKPRNYVGEFFAPPDQNVKNGNWYFDRREKCLVYLLNNGKIFFPDESNRMKFKVRLSRLPSNTAKPPGAPEMIDGVVLVQVYG